MRFSYAEPMIDPTFYAPLATAAEQAGYDSMVVPDSIMYPAESDSTYPYTCLLYTSPSPRDKRQSRMPSSA